MPSIDSIKIKGAKEHNLKNIDLEIPKNKFVVFTGVSGSGKSTLAMDTIYAEGQRRYVESLSSYARQFLGMMDKPEVESIEGLSPAIAIGQKTTSNNPRSTVGTVTEIYDFLRLLFARIGHPHCPQCGREISRQSTDQMVESILEIVQADPDYKTKKGVRYMIMSPVVNDRKGEYSALFKNLIKQGYVRARIDGQVRSLRADFELIKTNKHSIDAIINRDIITKKKLEEDRKSIESNLFQNLETALRLSDGTATFGIVKDNSFEFPQEPKEIEDHLFSENFACPVCNISIEDPEPRSFSFNAPQGACPACDGLGTQLDIDIDSVMNPALTLAQGGIFPWASLFEHYTWTGRVIKTVAKEYGFSIDDKIKDLSKKDLEILLYGAPQNKKFEVSFTRDGNTNTYSTQFEGLVPRMLRRHKETKSDYARNEIEKYMVKEPCPVCNGTRLNKQSLSVVIDGLNIADVTEMSIIETAEWFNHLEKALRPRELAIGSVILKEVNSRLQFLLNVGLGYLSLSRAAGNLSGGEAQRIRLASQIGSGLSGVLYVLDEPSIGLHNRDQGRLIKTLKHLRDLGNTVLVVEHDRDTMIESDYIFDFGPGAGEHGGEVIAKGTPTQIKNDKNSLTGDYLSGRKVVGNVELAQSEKAQAEADEIKRLHKGKFIELNGAKGRNLKNIDLKIPMGQLTCITGVSGSGKSTLIMDTLHRALRQEFGLKIDEKPLEFKELIGIDEIRKVIAIDQSPIGRTPKSNPATYTKTFDHIRNLFAQTQEAKIRGYKPGRFSFNVKGGRCEACGGQGQIKIEMQFMPDVYVDCEVCQGKRYNREALEIYYKGKNISDVLDMPVEEALHFFDNIPSIQRRLQTLYDVGLGYIRLGQPAPTLSGGEAQRVKLALELSKQSNSDTFYILDEPTTGLHFADLEKLIAILKRLTERGSTVLVIEHNLDVIANADWVVDLGPNGGNDGGQVIFSGSLEDLRKNKKSYTAEALRSF